MVRNPAANSGDVRDSGSIPGLGIRGLGALTAMSCYCELWIYYHAEKNKSPPGKAVCLNVADSWRPSPNWRTAFSG